MEKKKREGGKNGKMVKYQTRESKQWNTKWQCNKLKK